MSIETESELEAMIRVGDAVGAARDAMIAALRPGMSTAELDRIGEKVLSERGCRSAPRLAYGFQEPTISRARARRTAASRALPARSAARSNSARASARRPSFARTSARAAGSG